MKIYLLLILALISFGGAAVERPPIKNIAYGMDKKALDKFYPKKNARTYRETETEEWLTFNLVYNKMPGLVTFHLEHGELKDWQLNNRSEVIKEYTGEFVSASFKNSFPVINAAIHDVLLRIPFTDFLKITDRRRPVLFTEVFDAGTAKFASSSEIISFPEDAPAFQDGFTLIKLSTGLNEQQNQAAIVGVIAHEIAHRILEHVKNHARTCAAEREANALIKKWGFGTEYAQASQIFGHRAIGEPSPCADQ